MVWTIVSLLRTAKTVTKTTDQIYCTAVLMSATV